MGWFSNKKEEDIPELPELPIINNEQRMQMLPEKIEKLPNLLPKSMEELPDILPKSMEELQEVEEVHYKSPVKRITHTNTDQPFFIRIDKFDDAKKNLQEINKKLKDMQNVLEKINEIKNKEDEELASWKEDIKNIKAYLTEIDSDVFNKI